LPYLPALDWYTSGDEYVVTDELDAVRHSQIASRVGLPVLE
jgi:hypothetical protein